MLANEQKEQWVTLERQLRFFDRRNIQDYSKKEIRQYYDCLRQVLRLYEDVVYLSCWKNGVSDKDYNRLRSMAGRALVELGGQAEPASVSLRDYDHNRYGPFLGVSDEGTAVDQIREAALESPKMQVLGRSKPIVVGVSHDAERLGAVGEVTVGPDEYCMIRLGCIGRILTSTNVGTRLNLRYYKKRSLIEIPLGIAVNEAIKRASEQAQQVFEPFLHTPDGVPRPLTAFVHFNKKTPFSVKEKILSGFLLNIRKEKFCNPKYHRLGLFTYVGKGKAGVRTTKMTLDLAERTGLAEVAVEGIVRWAAADKISLPGLLNFFNARQTTDLLMYAAKKKVRLTPRNLVDTETVARNLWSGLRISRNMGLELGKYGLFPLTLPESNDVMRIVQSWFTSWTAAPALYVDLPIMDRTRVYGEINISEGIKRWLSVVAKHKIPVVLIDTADKDKGRRLLKDSPSDVVGILTRKEIVQLDAYARSFDIKVLWAGGLTIQQAYEMGEIGVFGIYVTTCVSTARPVAGKYRRDPMLPSEKEPTRERVYWVKVLLESGFLVSRCQKEKREGDASELEQAARCLIDVLNKKEYDKAEAMEKARTLAALAQKAWQRFWDQYRKVRKQQRQPRENNE